MFHTEGLRCLLVARRIFDLDIGETLTYRRVRQGIDDGGIELGDPLC